jgi:thioredoxin reductase
VVGGGIAGIQAALDLADSGYYVYRGIAFAHPYSFLTDDG